MICSGNQILLNAIWDKWRINRCGTIFRLVLVLVPELWGTNYVLHTRGKGGGGTPCILLYLLNFIGFLLRNV